MHTAPLNEGALEAMKRQLAYIKASFPNTLWLFLNLKSHHKRPFKDVKAAFTTLREEFGTPKFRVHDLRYADTKIEKTECTDHLTAKQKWQETISRRKGKTDKQHSTHYALTAFKGAK